VRELSPSEYFQHYEHALAEHISAERIALDVIIWMAIVIREAGVPHSVQPAILGRLIEHIGPMLLQKDINDYISILNELRKIDGETINEWVEELKESGRIKEGEAIGDDQRQSIEDALQNYQYIHFLAFFIPLVRLKRLRKGRDDKKTSEELADMMRELLDDPDVNFHPDLKGARKSLSAYISLLEVRLALEHLGEAALQEIELQADHKRHGDELY